MVTLQVALGDP